VANYTTTKTATGRWFLLSDNYTSVQGGIFSSTADADSPNRTTVLQPGLALTYSTSVGVWTNTLAGETCNGILLDEVDLLNGDTANDAANMPGTIVIAAAVASGQLLTNGVSVVSFTDRLFVHASATG
tara:strand:- start:2240 stop:2623 length:384 start_codon:yes stop_codon:yes gene_type:complete